MSLKILLLSILFVVSGGSLFSKYFHERRYLSFLAGVFALISTYYLLQSLYNDLLLNAANSPLRSEKSSPMQTLDSGGSGDLRATTASSGRAIGSGELSPIERLRLEALPSDPEASKRASDATNERIRRAGECDSDCAERKSDSDSSNLNPMEQLELKALAPNPEVGKKLKI
ncbi:MAG: hypothetical protein ABW157_09980 [Candidatus Thiodiazotropha sp. LLP2]